MTAEITILNKTAIALAADSAVTIGEGNKIYNTVNKLFSLSKFHPVGIMIFGNAELMDIPWETVIKVFRKILGKLRFNTLKEYGDKFFGFLNRQNFLFPASQQENYFYIFIRSYFDLIKDEIDEAAASAIKTGKNISDEKVKKIVEKVIQKHYEQWLNLKILRGMSKNFS